MFRKAQKIKQLLSFGKNDWYVCLAKIIVSDLLGVKAWIGVYDIWERERTSVLTFVSKGLKKTVIKFWHK